MSAFELALLPFEAAIAPNGFPGSGSPLFLQSKIPITLTREIRRGRPLPVEWNRPPRILFISASPHGLAPVPVKGHLTSLRRAIDPWVKIRDTEEERLEVVKEILTVLPDATLEQVRQASMNTEYSHVHILAHGAPFERAGDRRYGLSLCSGKKPGEADVVDGEALAIALTANRPSTAGARRRPTVLSLATCDSGNVRSVLTPGGSLAHELHGAGRPVSASKSCLRGWTICSKPRRPRTRTGKGFRGRRIVSAASSAGSLNPGGKNPPRNPAPRNWPNGWGSAPPVKNGSASSTGESPARKQKAVRPMKKRAVSTKRPSRMRPQTPGSSPNICPCWR